MRLQAKKSTKGLRGLGTPSPPLSQKQNQHILFCCDILSQPHGHTMREADPVLHYQCSRALPIATRNDIVVLHGSLDGKYHNWLLENNLSTKNVVCYNQISPTKCLAEEISDNPAPILEAIKKLKFRNLIYLPFYVSKKEIECANSLGIEIFGSPEEVTKEYFDKLSFKKECQKLGIQVVSGESHNINREDPDDIHNIEKIVYKLLHNDEHVIIRGTEGSAGRSAFSTQTQTLLEMYAKLSENKDNTILIEPMLPVICSPNDQWIITSPSHIRHLGTSCQIFEGLSHAGNLYGTYYSTRVTDFIEKTSKIIATAMAKRGYRGVLGIDYIVCEEGIYPIENNARMNGSTFAIELFNIIKKRIPELKYWKFYKASTTPTSFEDFREKTKKYLYDGIKINSIFPMVTELLPTKGQFIAMLMAEDRYHIDFLEDKMKQMGIN
jgi:predicted ATP-grasp superfamily ATP-dependent carboligase